MQVQRRIRTRAADHLGPFSSLVEAARSASYTGIGKEDSYRRTRHLGYDLVIWSSLTIIRLYLSLSAGL